MGASSADVVIWRVGDMLLLGSRGCEGLPALRTAEIGVLALEMLLYASPADQVSVAKWAVWHFGTRSVFGLKPDDRGQA